MPKIELVTKDVEMKIDRLQKRAPIVFNHQMMKFLHDGSQKIRTGSIDIAKREARGATGHYMQGFLISPIQKDSSGNLFVKIWNAELYSMVLEYGGRWNKMPPPMVLDRWVQKMFAPATESEAKSLAFAVASAILKRSKQGRKGQKMQRSKHKGKVMTMSRALIKSEPYLKERLSDYMEEGLRKI